MSDRLRFATVIVTMNDGTKVSHTCSSGVATNGVLDVTDSDHRSGVWTHYPLTAIRFWQVVP